MIFILLYLSQSFLFPIQNYISTYQLMEDKEKTVIVTGSNKGLGYGIVEHLAKCPIMKVIMACRNLDKANKAR